MRKIPTITRNLLIINVVCYLMTMFMSESAYALFGLHFFMAPDFKVYQLFTYMFLHGGFTHLLFNMFALWMFGCQVERAMGEKRYLLFYLACGIGAGLFQECAQLVHFWLAISGEQEVTGLGQLFSIASEPQVARVLNLWTTVGASGAIYGILLAFGMTFPDVKVFIIPIPFPVKAKWLIIGYAVIEVASAMAMPGDGVAHLAHLGGMVVGFFLIRYWRKNYGLGAAGGRYTRGWQTFKVQKGGAKPEQNDNMTSSTGNPDWDYNARKKQNQEETDRILDKIRRSGYDSLTAEEKKHLFNNK